MSRIREEIFVYLKIRMKIFITMYYLVKKEMEFAVSRTKFGVHE